ncbi:hypothetical protein MAR_038527, partial [Mya arenaria]
KGLSKSASEIVIVSWRNTTKKQYDGYIRKWIHYFGQYENPIKPDVKYVINFLSDLFKKGLSYSALNTARSAISVFIKICSNIDIHDNDILSSFNARPALPKYQSTWDVNIVLNYLHGLKTDTLSKLSQKLCMLFLLVTGQRCQTLHSIKLQDINISSDKQTVNISPSQLLKQSRPGTHLKPIILNRYTGKRNICILVSTNISSHIVHDLQILETAGWSNARTFAKFYLKEI